METGITLRDKLRKAIIRLILIYTATVIVSVALIHEIANFVLSKDGSFIWLGICIVGSIAANLSFYWGCKDTNKLLNEIDADSTNET